MRVLHVLDHSLPLHSGYTFRTAAILHEQRALGWETIQLTTPKQGEASGLVEVAEANASVMGMASQSTTVELAT